MRKFSLWLVVVLATASFAAAGERTDRELNDPEKTDVANLVERLSSDIEKHTEAAAKYAEYLAADHERIEKAGYDLSELKPLAAEVMAAKQAVIKPGEAALKALKEATNYRQYIAARCAYWDWEIARTHDRIVTTKYTYTRRMADWLRRRDIDKRLADNPEKKAQYDKLIGMMKQQRDIEVALVESSLTVFETRKKSEQLGRLDIPDQEDLIRAD